METRHEYESGSTLWSRGMPSEIYMQECEPLKACCIECGIPLLIMRNAALCGNCGRVTQPLAWDKEMYKVEFRSEKPIAKAS